MSDEIYLSSTAVDSGVAIAPFLSKSPPPVLSDASEHDLSMDENRVVAVDELNDDSTTSDTNVWNAFDNGDKSTNGLDHNVLKNGAAEAKLNGFGASNHEVDEGEDDDEWGDFVETDDKSNIHSDAINTSNNESNVNVNVNTTNIAAPSSQTRLDIPANDETLRHQPAVTNTNNAYVSKLETPVNSNNNNNNSSKISEPTFIEFNYSNVIDRIFGKLPSSFSFADSVGLNEINIDTDDVWKELKTYTSINDASSSLKFKWLLSNLEDNYLNSINVNRVLLKHLQKTSASNFISNHILQPVKVDQIAQSHSSSKNDPHTASVDKIQNPINSKSNKSLESEFIQGMSHNDEHQVKSDFQTQIQPNSTITNNNNNKLNSTPVLDLDLSYFEKKSSSSSTNNSHASSSSTSSSSSSSSSTLKSNLKTSKNYIDKLLQDIYVNTDKHHAAVSKVDNKK